MLKQKTLKNLNIFSRKEIEETIAIFIQHSNIYLLNIKHIIYYVIIL